MAKRHLEQYDSQGNQLEIYLNSDEVKHDGQPLDETLEQMQHDIEEAGKGGGGEGTVTGVRMNGTTHEPTDGVVDLGTVVTQHQDITGKANKSEMSVVDGTGTDADKITITLKEGTSATVLKEHQDISGKVDKNGTDSLMTAAEHTKLQNLPTADELSQQMGTKANSSDVANTYATKSELTSGLSGKQNTLTFDIAPTAGSNNPVKSGGIKTALDKKADITDVYDKEHSYSQTEVDDAIDDAFSNAQVTVVPANSVGIIDGLGSDSGSDALSAKQGKALKVAILTLWAYLGEYAFPEGKPNLSLGVGAVEFSVTYPTDSKITATPASGTAPSTVELLDSLEVTLGIDPNYNLYVLDDDSVKVYMAGNDITLSAYNPSTGVVSIDVVVGNIMIVANTMTYVDIDGNDNKLAFHLDCKNRGGQDGHWIDLIGNKDFALTDVTAADDGMVFNGSTSKGVASGSLDVYYRNNTYGSATIEAVIDISSLTPTTSEQYPVLANTLDGRVAALFRTASKGEGFITCATNSTGIDNVDGQRNSAFFFEPTNKSFGTTQTVVVVDGVEPANPRIVPGQGGTDVNDYTAGVSSVLAVGYGNISSTERFFKGKIMAIRVYKTKLTAEQIKANYKIDQKRFNLS